MQSAGGSKAGYVAEPTAKIEDGAVIGPGTRLWDHVHVREGARIGSGCNIAKNVYVDTDVVIGDRVKIQNNVSVYHGVTVEDDVFLGPSCVFTNDLLPRAGSTDWQVVPTKVHRGASVGANATVLCGTTLGRWAMIAAGSVVTHDVEPHQLVRGNPARPAGWVCRGGAVISRDAKTPPTSLHCDDCGPEEPR